MSSERTDHKEGQDLTGNGQSIAEMPDNKLQDAETDRAQKVSGDSADTPRVTGYDIALNIIGWVTAILLIFATAVILRSTLRDHASWIVMIVVGVLGILAAVNTAASVLYTVRNIKLAFRKKKK